MATAFVTISVIGAISIFLCWISYLLFCFSLARRDANWSEGASSICKAFWKNVYLGFKSGTYDPRNLPKNTTPPHEDAELDDSTD
ncbi:hypothetical protein [Streptomyces sp. B1I3]|uniref:hypothetical protein n=1 Tax=Streptomyces sp. B1I3 TaxID=3042264 RepID=UPI0027819BEF|nr:hypothetical protein [Streptomyces sp. B1I3]MDQ0798200.1 hypothetical protein [Streptomyces sp. B1I3]